MWIELAASEKNRKQRFLEEMERVIPWETLITLCKKYYKRSRIGRPKTDMETLLKIYFLQQWYNLGDPTVEAEIYDSIAFRRFLNIDLVENVPDETTICRFRHFLEEHRLQEKFFRKTVGILEEKGLILRRGTIVDATIVQASGSTKNKAKKRDPEMSSTKKNNNYHFGMKEHIGVDIQSGLIHTIEATTAKVADIQKLEDCLHGYEEVISGDKAYGTKERKQQMRKEGKTYLIIDKKNKRRKPENISETEWEKIKKIPTQLSTKQKKRNKKISSVRSKVEHPFGIIKNLWKHRRVRYKGLLKNALQWNTLAMLSNFYRLRKIPLLT